MKQKIAAYKVLDLTSSQGIWLSLGVSICLDVVSIETLDLDTKKSQSRRPKKSRQFQKVSLDDREISILSRHVQKVRKVSIETEKPAETWHFWQISTVCLDLDRELVNIITVLDRDFSICRDFWAWSLEKVLKKSRLCREISKILDKSRKSRFVSTISICLDDLDKYLDEDKSRPKNLDFKNLDRDKIKVGLDRRENLDKF